MANDYGAYRVRRKVIELSVADMVHLDTLAKGRNAKEAKCKSSLALNAKGCEFGNLVGLCGEMAVSKCLGLPIDERIFEYHGDDGTDLVGRLRIDVKTTTWVLAPLLRVEVSKWRSDLDAYVLCAVDASSIRLDGPVCVSVVGWATPTEVKRGEQKRFKSYMPLNYVLTEALLRDVAELR